MKTGKQLVVETNLGGGGSFSCSHSNIRSLSGSSVILFPKTYEIFVISMQCLMIVIFHDIFVRILCFCITYKRLFSIIHTPIWKSSQAICFFMRGINNFLENSISSAKRQLYLGAKLFETGACLRSGCGISNPYLLPNLLVVIWRLSDSLAYR